MGSVSTSGQFYTEGSQITYQCNDGLFPVGVLTANCTNGVWEPGPSAVVCKTTPGKLIVFVLIVDFFSVSTCTVNCTIPSEPSNGTIVDYEKLNKTVLEGTVLTYKCDDRLSMTGPNNITCTNARVWSTDPDVIMCVIEGELIARCYCYNYSLS